MFDWVTHAVLSFVSDYGYFAVFVYMALETAFILHFAPSELVVPFAASQLVHDPLSFGIFVLDATVGATVGSVLAYFVLGKNSEYVLGRYGHLVHVTEDDIHRGRRWFQRWGESSVLWGRMVPLMRAVISIPAGIAEMDLRKFVTYSASGAFAFNLLLTFLVYSGAGETSPLGILLGALSAEVTETLTYAQLHPRVVVVLGGLAGVALGSLWLSRNYIRQNPAVSQRIILRVLWAGGTLVGSLFLLGAVVTPLQSFRTATNIWDDPLFFTRFGLSPQLALLLTGVAFCAGALAVFELGKRVPVAELARRFRAERLSW
ncbi:SNARE associated protein-related protein [Haladaptatus sp. W1]|uniref:DedA family protein n=1 Tax=Haladaptatus sp. W1 TaxID=1897478 RepID=UPI000849BA2D|nr:DedA family protein [Haladaptatus sp. W1]ODR81204.1 SNARE associated protein-related protein [Haladaptatus sp. W1]